ncbi:MAG TPA: (2Fe-2S)-binding protein [Candidatus Atribacteria bacterium]|nr:(2Fe-2S)-binding protein [Candidatus Atribacteria bacterium]
MKREINFTLNGYKVSVEVEPNEKLLDVLRDKLGVKSPKYGCGRGECGSCSVLLNGKSVRSCITLAIEVDGQEIVTLEGLEKDGITDIQKSFLEHNAFQCGFCAPGFIITTTELLSKNSHPEEEEIREAVAGNLCRCTGYDTIIKAILDVSEKE